MCDTLCVVGGGRALFAKNSDRLPSETQVVEVHLPRASGGSLRTQYLDIDDVGAYAVMGSRPTWLWGFEHGVNEHRVAIGNEKIWTIDDAHAMPPALIGMDLVRLGLERARSADEALDVMTTLLERHGQGGSGELDHDEPYFSSFLVADPRAAWILETSGRTWAARPVEGGAAISNRITLGTDWTRASSDVGAGSDFDRWRDPEAPTGVADHRLAVARECVATGAAALTPADLAATMRHHGNRPWGAPGADPLDVDPPPETVDAAWRGITVCMHVRDFQATTASMIAELPEDPDTPLRAWIALGSPCAGIYVPVFPPFDVPVELADPATWDRFARLRDRVEADGAELTAVRAVLGPLEAQLWEEADAASWSRVDAALTRLGVP